MNNLSLRSVRTNALCKLALFCLVLLNTTKTKAQQPPSFSGNYYKDQAGVSFTVNSPASIASNIEYTLSNDGLNGWGGAITSPYINAQVVKADNFFACNTLVNGTGSIPSLAGKFALVQRGSCDFSTKAYNAQQAGAIGVIIVNNAPGSPTSMGSGTMGSMVSIPVLMISQAAGNAINSVIGSQTVTITLSGWATGTSNDVGIINGGMAQWHANVMPKSLLSSASAPYKGITAGFVANFGTTTMTNVQLKSEITFTPTAGTPSTVHKDSVIISSFAAADSIKAFISPDSFSVGTATTGKYDVTYTLTANQTDGNLINNTKTNTFYVSDSLMSKGRYDMMNGVPVITNYYAFAMSTDFVFGPLYYISKGHHVAKSLQFSVSANTSDLSLFSGVNIALMKWDDGLVTKDSIIQSGELTISGLAYKGFVPGDTARQIFTVPITDPNNTSLPCILDSNSWYWVAAEVPAGLYLACDGGEDHNYFLRSYGRANQPGSSYKEYYAPVYNGTLGYLFGSTSETPSMLPFEATNDINASSFTQQKKNTMPAIALRIVPQISLSANVLKTCPGTSGGRIIITAVGGTAPYSYKLNGSAPQTSDTFTNITPGNYTVLVTDANQVNGYLEVKVDSFALPVVNAGTSVAITEGKNTNIGGNPTASGNAPFTYTWTPSATLNNATAANPVATPTATTIYYVHVIDANGCTNSDDITVAVFPAGIKEVNKDIKVEAYPNPANTFLNIKAEVAENGYYELQLTNLSGAVTYKELVTVTGNRLEKQLRLSHYPDGIYFVNIKNSKSQTVIKVEKLTPTR